MGMFSSKSTDETEQKTRYMEEEHKEKKERNHNKRTEERHGPEASERSKECVQPTETENTEHCATNNGIKVELDKRNEENMKQNNYIPPNIGNNNEKDNNVKVNKKDKKTEKYYMGDKHKEKGRDKQGKNKGYKNHRRKHKQKQDDSSEDSSTSSESSSSSDIGHVNSSRKFYNNKGGGTTIVSKKTVIGGSKMSIGENAGIVTVNIGTDNSAPVVKKEENTRPFESFYTKSSGREEERRQFTSQWGQEAATPPGGNFIDIRELHIKEFVFESGVRVDAARWVCMICFPGGNGTGFRVGPRHIMTANHVVKHILDTVYQQVGHNQDPFAPLQSPGVHAIFNFTTDGPVSDRQKFRFKAVVPFHDDATDCAVLELEDNSMGTEIPLSFTFFSLPRLNDKFTFIGHSLGSRMEFNHVDRIIDLNSTETQRDIKQVKQSSLQHSGKDFETRPHNILTNPNRFLFHCKFTKGASGSPGVVILPDGRVVVVTMLLCGFPDWYYDPLAQDNVKNSWPKDYCVEQGVNLKSVYEKMSSNNPMLCKQIFFGHLDSIPNPNI